MKRQRKTGTILSALLFFALIFLWLPAGVVSANGPDGKIVYEKNCKMCHGVDGKSAKKTASVLKVDLAKLDLTDKETNDKKDVELVKTVSDGNGKAMKGFKDKLTQEEITAVIKYIRSLEAQKPAK